MAGAAAATALLREPNLAAAAGEGEEEEEGGFIRVLGGGWVGVLVGWSVRLTGGPLGVLEWLGRWIVASAWHGSIQRHGLDEGVDSFSFCLFGRDPLQFTQTNL